MGLYGGNLGDYYSNPSLETLGSYQFVSLDDIINQFMVVYVGEDKIISKARRIDVQFHAMRGMQELSYDTFRSCKTLELEVPNSLLLPIPHDYVEYTKISWIDDAGICHAIRQCKKCPKDPLSYKQDDQGDIMVGVGGREVVDQILITEGYWQDTTEIDHSKQRTEEMIQKGLYWYIQEYIPPVYQDVYATGDPIVEDSTTWANTQSGDDIDPTTVHTENDIYHTNRGQRYGIDPQHANSNGCFWINCNPNHPGNGKIYFDSNLAGKTVTIQYISDGLADYSDMIVHKFAEEAMYKHIAHSILNTRANIDPNVVATYKRERFAAVRNAKLRLSSIKLEEITQILRGKSKWIKH